VMLQDTASVADLVTVDRLMGNLFDAHQGQFVTAG